MSAEGWGEARNVLCVRLDTIGDVLMTTPAIRALRESVAGRRITLLTSSAGARVAPFIPEVDELIVYDAPWLKATPPRQDSRGEYAMADRLREGQFDAAAIFTVYSQNPLPAAFLCYLADIPRRLAHGRENPYQLLTDWIPEPEPQQFIRHEVRRHLDLVAAVGGHTTDERLSMHAPARAVARVAALLAEMGVVEGKFLVIHPGVTAPSRQYPPESYAQVARLLVQEHGWQILFTGSGAEADLVAYIQGLMGGAPAISLVDALDLGELAALLQRSPLLIANNTGPVHVAAAVGTPVVDLYALTNPQHTPWGVPHRVLFHDVPCKYCYRSICPEGHHNCLRLVEPTAVVAAALELVAGGW